MKKFLRSLVFVLGLVGTAAMAANPAYIPTVQNIAGLKALGAAAPQYPDVKVLGYYTANDGGGSLVHWNAASTATQDNAYVFQATGVTTGRYFRNLEGQSLNLLQCGAKADNSTDNTTTIQQCYTAVSNNNLGEIYCPAAASSYNFVGPVTPVGGSLFRGAGSTVNTSLGSSSLAPGVCYMNHTGTGKAFDFQTTFQSAVACPSVPGPKFANFNMIEASTGNSIRVNDSTTAGFSDDCVAIGGGQSQVFGVDISNVAFSSSQRGTTAIECNKCFDSTYEGNYFTFYDTQIKIKGSDNQLISNNKFKLATLRAIDLSSSGTFGNFNSVVNNTLYSVFTNATDFVSDSSRSGDSYGNYFEVDFAGITSILNLTCALAHSWHDNTMALIPANVSYWLKVTGDCTQLTLTNNYPLGGGSVPSSWNAGTGSLWFANSTKQKIFAWGNPDDNSQTPFVTREPVPALPNQPNNYTGALLGVFDSSTTANLAGNYANSIKIGPPGFSGAFAFAPVAAAGGHVTFKFIPRVAGTVDFTIYANTAGATNQQITCTDGVTTTTMTIAGGTQKRWYTFSAAGGDVVDDPTIDCYNNDTGHNQTVYVYKWAANLH